MEMIKETVLEIFWISTSFQKLLMKTLFSSELDFVSKLLSAACVAFLVIEILYLVLPRSLQRKLEAIDYVKRQGAGGFQDYSSTAALAGLNAFILALTVI